MKRSTLLLPAAVLLVAALGACASDGDAVRSDGTSTTGPGETSTTVPPTEPGDSGAIPANQVVWQQVTGGGFVPTQAVAAEVPEVTIYGDGRVIVSVPDSGSSFDRAASLDIQQVSVDEVRSLLEDAAASGSFDEGADFGQPGVTDMPSTTVTMHGTGDPKTVSVYALGFDTSSSVGEPYGITKEQAAAREGLSKLLARAHALGEGGEEYEPSRVRATLFDPAMSGEITTNAASEWPGPAFAEFPKPTEGNGMSCLVIEDEYASAVYEAARNSTTSVYTSGTDTRQVIVAPLVPGQEGCPS